MNIPSLLRGPVKMLWILSVIVFSFPSLSFSALPRPGDLNGGSITPFRSLLFPYIDGTNDGFAYMVQATSSRQDVYLARLESVTPLPTALDVGKLQSYDLAEGETVSQLKASVANDRLFVESTIQGPNVLDVNLDFFDLQTGAHVGFINEQSFATFNSSLQPSQRLAERRAAWVAQNIVTQEQADAFDYYLDPDDHGTFNVYGGWNSDGTASIFFETSVFLANAGPYTGMEIGTETFAINLGYSAVTKQMEIVDYGLAHTAATYPSVFKFSLKAGKFPYILFQGTPILFQSRSRTSPPPWAFIFNTYRTAAMVEAEIPALYYHW